MIEYMQMNYFIAINLICSLPLLIAFIISLRQYLAGRYRHNLFQMLTWFALSVWSFGATIADIFLSIPLKIIADYFVIIAGFSVILLLDSVSREYIDPLKLSIIHILSALLVFGSIQEGALKIDVRQGQADFSLITSGYFKIVGALLLLTEGLLILYVWTRLYKQSPNSLKKMAKLNLTGGILIGFITPILYIFGFSVILPGSTSLMMALGALFSAIAFQKEPRLAYVLPFRASRLCVIETNGGLALFTHDWVKNNDFADNMLFSGMIQGLQGIMRESLKRGEVREVHLDNAILLIQRSDLSPLVSVLVADKSNHSLRTALMQFMDDFDHEFKVEIRNFRGDISTFDRAKKLVQKNYPYIPTYE